MSGVVDPEHVEARRTLLDALEVLGDHLDALVLVGAQAVYCYTGATDLQVSEYTTDADLSINPEMLSSAPLLSAAMAGAGFTSGDELGRWKSPTGVYVDLMVPEALAGGKARRSVPGLKDHGEQTARRAHGLEAAMVDRRRFTLGALDPADQRRVEMWVAGPAALVVAKVYKIVERIGKPGRLVDKDALDLYRLVVAAPTATLVSGFELILENDLSAQVATRALQDLQVHFAEPDSEGPKMAARASNLSDADADVIGLSLGALVTDLLEALSSR